MVGTILPIVYGERKQHSNSGRTSVAAYAVGLLVGGAMLGTAISLFGFWFRFRETVVGRTYVEVLFLALLVHALLGLREIGVIKIRLPQSHWQVKRVWAQELHPQIASLVYGLILGSGVFTRISTGLFYAFLIWVRTVANWSLVH